MHSPLPPSLGPNPPPPLLQELLPLSKGNGKAWYFFVNHSLKSFHRANEGQKPFSWGGWTSAWLCLLRSAMPKCKKQSRKAAEHQTPLKNWTKVEDQRTKDEYLLIQKIRFKMHSPLPLLLPPKPPPPLSQELPSLSKHQRHYLAYSTHLLCLNEWPFEHNMNHKL